MPKVGRSSAVKCGQVRSSAVKCGKVRKSAEKCGKGEGQVPGSDRQLRSAA